MTAMEIIGCKVAAAADRQRQRIAHGQHSGGAGGGCQVQRACFHHVADGQMHIAKPRQVRLMVATDTHATDPVSAQNGGQVDQFFSAAGVADEDRHIASAESAQVAVDGLAWMHEVRGQSEA